MAINAIIILLVRDKLGHAWLASSKIISAEALSHENKAKLVYQAAPVCRQSQAASVYRQS